MARSTLGLTKEWARQTSGNVWIGEYATLIGRDFSKVAVRYLTAPTSDHNPIILDTHVGICSRTRPFRFEVMWTKEESSLEVVDKAWFSLAEGSHSFQLAHKIHKIQKDFKLWNKNVFGLVKARIKEIEYKIGEIQDIEPSFVNLA